MEQHHNLSISPDKMLTSIHEQLTIHFFESSKTAAKSEFNRLKAGEKVPFLNISAPRKGEVEGSLALEASEFVGTLNYSKFRDALGSHLNHIARSVNNKQNLNIMTNEENGAFLFNLPGLVVHDDVLNVLVTGVHQEEPGEIVIKLMFLNPDDFREAVDQAKERRQRMEDA